MSGSDYAANAPSCDAWLAANDPSTCKDAITHWPDWYGDTPAYAPWAKQIDEKLAEKLKAAQSAPVVAIGVFRDSSAVNQFLGSHEFDKLVEAYLEKKWHLRPYTVPERRNVCAFYLNTEQMAALCPLLRAVRKSKDWSTVY